MDPNQGLNIESSKKINILSDKTENKGSLKGSQILDNTKKKDVGIEKIKKINSETLTIDNTQSISEQNSLDNRIETSSTNTKEKDKILEIKSKNPILKEDISISKAARLQNKTEIIKEKCVRYMIDPDKQVEDILDYVESSYKNHPLQSTYDLAKKLVEKDDLQNITEDMQKEIEEATKHRDFFSISIFLAKIYLLRKEIKKYGEEFQYDFNPRLIMLIALAANELVDKHRHGNSDPEERLQFLEEIKVKPFSKFFNLENNDVNEDEISQCFYKHFYPIVLCGDLSIFTFEAEIYAYANNLALIGVGGSERGVHGGIFQTAGDVFIHDSQHHLGMLYIDSPTQAICLEKLSSSLIDILEKKIPDNLRKLYYFASHLLIHEKFNLEIEEDLLLKRNPTLKNVFELYFCDFLTSAAVGFALEEHPFEPVEAYIRNLQLEEEKAKAEFGDTLPEKTRQSIDNKYKNCEEYTKNHPLLDDIVVHDNDDSFAYDMVETLISLTDDPEKNKELKNKLLPNFPDLAKSIMEDCKKKHHITDETDKNSEVFNAYRKDYNHQLFLYKAHNFNHLEGYKEIKKLMIEFKDYILPYLEEIDKKNGPINTSNHKNVWEKGAEIN